MWRIVLKRICYTLSILWTLGILFLWRALLTEQRFGEDQPWYFLPASLLFIFPAWLVTWILSPFWRPDVAKGVSHKTTGGGGKPQANTPETLTLEEATEIIENYGSILETQSPAPDRWLDVSKLPYPKDRIKEALIIGLSATTDSDMKEQLKIGYLKLASWQDGVGDRVLGPPDTDSYVDPEEMAVIATLSAYLAPAVAAEAAELKQELVDLGLW